MSLRHIHDFELQLLDVCLAMSKRGVRINDALRRQRIKDLEASIGPLTEELQAIVHPLLYRGMPQEHLFRPKLKKGELVVFCQKRGLAKERWPKKAVLERYLQMASLFWSYNPSSPKQNLVVLYSIIRLPKRFEGKRLSVAEDKLKDLLAYDKSGLVAGLLRLAKQSTMRSIYERIAPGPDGRIRTFYNPAGTETGRFNSAASFLVPSTNLQNMPKKSALAGSGYNVRQCFVADDGMALIEADLSQAEARIVAALSGDKKLLAAWSDPTFDVHRWTAAHIFNKEPDDVTKQERELGKRARHALNYGMGWKTFQSSVNEDADSTGVSLTPTEAKHIRSAYHRLHPSLQVWWNNVRDILEQFQGLSTVFGRKRTFFGRRRGDGYLDETHKEAIAFEPQSTVADLLNHGMLHWFKHYDGKIGQLLLQVHDSILVQVPRGREKAAALLLRRCLERELTVNGTTLVVPADVSVGPNWAAMERV